MICMDQDAKYIRNIRSLLEAWKLFVVRIPEEVVLCDFHEFEFRSWAVTPRPEPKPFLLDSWIWADEVRIRQIITNLLSNAAKFTNEGGQIEMRASAKPCRRAGPVGGASPERGPPEAELRAEAELPLYELTVSVRDTGIGMPTSFQKVLFEAFTQCDNSRTKKYEGTPTAQLTPCASTAGTLFPPTKAVRRLRSRPFWSNEGGRCRRNQVYRSSWRMATPLPLLSR